MPSQWGSDQLPTASARWGIPTTLLIKDCQSLRQCFQISPAYNVPKNLCFIKVDPDFFVPQLWTKNCFWATSDLKNMILGLFCHVVYNPKDFLKILDAQITPSKGRILKNAMLDGSFDFKTSLWAVGHSNLRAGSKCQGERWWWNPGQPLLAFHVSPWPLTF